MTNKIETHATVLTNKIVIIFCSVLDSIEIFIINATCDIHKHYTNWDNSYIQYIYFITNVHYIIGYTTTLYKHYLMPTQTFSPNSHSLLYTYIFNSII